MFVIPMLVGVLLLPISDEHHNVYCNCYLARLVTRYVSVHNSALSAAQVAGRSYKAVPTVAT